MEVLVTGATGYTGSGITDALVVAGHRVSGRARSDGSARRLEERGIRAVKGDITDAGSVREAARGTGADGKVEDWPLDEALEELVDHAYALTLDQRLSGERARRLLGWMSSAPSVFEEPERGSYS